MTEEETDRDPTWGEIEDMSPEEQRDALGADWHGELKKSFEAAGSKFREHHDRLSGLARSLSSKLRTGTPLLDQARLAENQAILDHGLLAARSPVFDTNEKLDSLIEVQLEAIKAQLESLDLCGKQFNEQDSRSVRQTRLSVGMLVLAVGMLLIVGLDFFDIGPEDVSNFVMGLAAGARNLLETYVLY